MSAMDLLRPTRSYRSDWRQPFPGMLQKALQQPTKCSCNHLHFYFATTYISGLQLSTFLFYNKQIFAIVDWKHTFAIEIKSANAPEAKLSANTKKYLELRKDDNARNAVFYLGDVSMTINGTSYVAWKDWGDFL